MEGAVRALKLGNGLMSPTQQRQLQFWTGWSAWLRAKGSTLQPRRPWPQYWANLPPWRPGIQPIAAVNFRDRRLSMEVYIEHPKHPSMFLQLLTEKASIESAIQVELDWQHLTDGHGSRIRQFGSGSALASDTTWPECFAWLEHAALQMTQALKPRVHARA